MTKDDTMCQYVIRMHLPLKKAMKPFYMYVPDPIYMVFDVVMNYKKEQAAKFLRKLTTAGGKRLDNVLKQKWRVSP